MRPLLELTKKQSGQSLAGKNKELDAMEAFDIFDVCGEIPTGAKIITTRWENVPKGDKW